MRIIMHKEMPQSGEFTIVASTIYGISSTDYRWQDGVLQYYHEYEPGDGFWENSTADIDTYDEGTVMYLTQEKN